MMLTLITICVFASIALTMMFLGRVLMRPAAATAGPRDTLPAFGPFNDALAAQIPHRRAFIDSLDVQLSRAGCYGRHARRNFLATRNILVLGIVLLTVGLVLVEGPEQPIVAWSIAGGGVLLAGLAYAVPRLLLNIKARRRVERIERGLPDALDILTMCLAGGLPLRRSLQHLVEEIDQPHADLADELRIVMRQEELGSLPQAFDHFARRTASADVRSLSVLVGDAQRLGADVREAAREQADGIRRTFRFQADERASRAGAKLILPFVFCLLPGVAILLWSPAVLELRETLARETRPGGAFSQDVPRSIEELRREMGLQPPNRDQGGQAGSLPFYRQQPGSTSGATSRNRITRPATNRRPTQANRADGSANNTNRPDNRYANQ